NLPDSHLVWHGGNPPGALFVWYFIALATLIEPSFYQRCFAAKNEKVARNGILISILFWIVFDFLATFSGLYARALLSDDANPMLSYPLLAENLMPIGLQGLFYLGLLSVVMSTVDSYSFLAAQTLGRDIVARYRYRIANPLSNRHIQVGLVLSALLAILIAVWKESAVSIWHDLGSIGTSMLLLPMAGSFTKHPLFSGKIVFPAMLLAGGVTLFWTLNGSYGQGYPLGIQPIYIGLTLSATLLFGGRILIRDKQT
ncbi:hypothetical protein K8I28_17745, partial [bacterium]|nr:hypothetical protein [bacterium]